MWPVSQKGINFQRGNGEQKKLGVKTIEDRNSTYVHTLRTPYAKDEGSSSTPLARIFTVIEKFVMVKPLIEIN